MALINRLYHSPQLPSHMLECHSFFQPTQADFPLILSISVDTFSQENQHLLCNTQRVIASLMLNHERKSVIGRAYPPVVPIADKISPDEGFQLMTAPLMPGYAITASGSVRSQTENGWGRTRTCGVSV